MTDHFGRRLLAALADSTPAFRPPQGRRLAYLTAFEAVVYAWLCGVCGWLAITLVAEHIILAVWVGLCALVAGLLSFVNAYHAKTYFTRKANQ